LLFAHRQSIRPETDSRTDRRAGEKHSQIESDRTRGSKENNLQVKLNICQTAQLKVHDGANCRWQFQLSKTAVHFGRLALPAGATELQRTRTQQHQSQQFASSVRKRNYRFAQKTVCFVGSDNQADTQFTIVTQRQLTDTLTDLPPFGLAKLGSGPPSRRHVQNVPFWWNNEVNNVHVSINNKSHPIVYQSMMPKIAP